MTYNVFGTLLNQSINQSVTFDIRSYFSISTPPDTPLCQRYGLATQQTL